MSIDFDSARLPCEYETDDHRAWRETLRRFLESEVIPHAERWDEEGAMPASLWKSAAEIGLLGLGYPCLLYTSPSPRDGATSRMPSSA